MLDSFLKSEEEPAIRIESADTPHYSISEPELMERIDGDRAFLSELLALIRADYPSQLQEIREAAAHGDGAEVQRVGHALKGALGNLAASIAAGIAGEIEALGRSGDLAAAASLVPILADEMERVTQQLESLCLEAVQ